MKIIATKGFRYAGRAVRAGDEVEAKMDHAKLLCEIGKAMMPAASGGMVTGPAVYQRRDMQAEAGAAAEQKAQEPEDIAKAKKSRLIEIATAEGVAVTDGDSKTDLIARIERARAAR